MKRDENEKQTKSFSVGLPSNEDLNTGPDLIRQRLETTAITSDLIPFVSENSNYELMKLC